MSHFSVEILYYINNYDKTQRLSHVNLFGVRSKTNQPKFGFYQAMKRRKHHNGHDDTYKKSSRNVSNDKIVLFSPSLLDELVATKENPPTLPPLVDLDKELTRFEYIRNLRGLYEHLLLVIVDMPVPKLSFERWLSERLMLLDLSGQPKHDPVIPVDVEPRVSTSLYKEIIEDVPTKVTMFPRNLREGVDALTTWTNAAITLTNKTLAPINEVHRTINATQYHCSNLLEIDDEIVNNTNATDYELSDDEKNSVNERCSEALKWVKGLRHDDEKTRIVDKIKELQLSLCPLLYKKLHSRVELTCKLLLRAADQFNKRLYEAQRTKEEITSQYKQVKVERCSKELTLEFKDQKVVVQIEHYNKLKALFRRTCGEHEEVIPGCLFAMLLRYEMCMSPSLPRKGSGLHAALPGKVFAALNQLFGVTTECFASPLNSFYGSYCSAYYDTDVFFGSFGSFFNYKPTSGSFEVNPPFVEQVILKCAERIDTLLSDAQTEPLSFIVFIPNWEDSPGLQRMIASSFKRYDMVLREFEHSYVSGLQHQEKPNYVQYKAVHATRVIFLQNDLGFKKWTPSSENLRRISRN